MGRGRPGRMLRHASADELVGPPQSGIASIRKLFPTWDTVTIDFLAQCLRMDPDLRPQSFVLLQHFFFTQNGFVDKFLVQLQNCIEKESDMNPLTCKRFEERRSVGNSSVLPSRKLCCENDLRYFANSFPSIFISIQIFISSSRSFLFFSLSFSLYCPLQVAYADRLEGREIDER